MHSRTHYSHQQNKQVLDAILTRQPLHDTVQVHNPTITCSPPSKYRQCHLLSTKRQTPQLNRKPARYVQKRHTKHINSRYHTGHPREWQQSSEHNVSEAIYSLVFAHVLTQVRQPICMWSWIVLEATIFCHGSQVSRFGCTRHTWLIWAWIPKPYLVTSLVRGLWVSTFYLAPTNLAILIYIKRISNFTLVTILCMPLFICMTPLYLSYTYLCIKSLMSNKELNWISWRKTSQMICIDQMIVYTNSPPLYLIGNRCIGAKCVICYGETIAVQREMKHIAQELNASPGL